MENTYWECPVCGFEARDDDEKNDHERDTKNDPEHKRAADIIEKAEEMKSKGEDVVKKAQDKIKDVF